MNATQHQNIVGFIWNIANKLRGPYRPPQYRRVMLPLVVLRRLDLVLEPTKEAVLAEYKRLSAKGIKDAALDKALSRAATGGEREQPLYNISPFTFQKLLGDPPHIVNNLIAYIHGFSPRARDIFDKFDFEAEILKLDEANRLYLIIQEFCSPDVDLSPQRVKNLQMGYLFEELVRKFNEQANEEAGDHFTPREVIRLMVNLLFSGEQDIYTQGISKSIYDPTAGTGGMLSVSEEFIRRQNPDANLQLYGQEYNPEAYALCCAEPRRAGGDRRVRVGAGQLCPAEGRALRLSGLGRARWRPCGGRHRLRSADGEEGQRGIGTLAGAPAVAAPRPPFPYFFLYRQASGHPRSAGGPAYAGTLLRQRVHPRRQPQETAQGLSGEGTGALAGTQCRPLRAGYRQGGIGYR